MKIKKADLMKPKYFKIFVNWTERQIVYCNQGRSANSKLVKGILESAYEGMPTFIREYNQTNS
jgi:hypothetical protein